LHGCGILRPMKAFPQLRAGTGLFFAGVLIVIGLVPLVYFAALGLLQLWLSVQAGKWIALPLTLAFSDHALLASARSAPALPLIPQFPWIADPTVAPFLDRVHVALIPALAGLALLLLGMLRVYLHRALLRLHRQHAEDRTRRVQDYQRESGDFIDGRREPFISNRRAA
jgi:hypothetical protein